MEKLGAILSDLLEKTLPQDREDITLVFLKELWPHIVGQELALHTDPRALHKKRLLIKVPSETWEKELAALKPVLLEKINRFWKSHLVNVIHFEVSPGRGS